MRAVRPVRVPPPSVPLALYFIVCGAGCDPRRTAGEALQIEHDNPEVKPGDAGAPLDLAKSPGVPFDFAGVDYANNLPQPDLLDCADADGDGFKSCEGDCDDHDPAIHPGAKEICNGRDDNCNGQIDEGFDEDQDGWTTCAGDCDDQDANVHPGARPLCDGADANCNGLVDKEEDFDGDGWPVCDDCNDADAMVNAGAMEVVGDQIDNNCNGLIDEAPASCDGTFDFNSEAAGDYAEALDLCPDQFFIGASFAAEADHHSHSIAPAYGLYTPREGHTLIALSTGVAAAEGEPYYVAPQDGTSWTSSASNPIPMGMNCGGVDPGMVYDYTELVLTLKAPTNARSITFDFNFMSAEYPEWVCQAFNDKFLAILQSKSYEGNVSFDAKGSPVTVNNGFFTVTQAADLAGTGYEIWDAKHNGPAGAGTGWLSTTAPVTPGETLILRFIVFDEGDHILDSVALIDHLRWQLTPAADGPTTVRTM